MIFNAEKFKLWSHSQTEYSIVTFLSHYFLSLYYAAKFWIWAGCQSYETILELTLLKDNNYDISSI